MYIWKSEPVGHSHVCLVTVHKMFFKVKAPFLPVSLFAFNKYSFKTLLFCGVLKFLSLYFMAFLYFILVLIYVRRKETNRAATGWTKLYVHVHN
ncbi:hypothetical protein XELAEV_18045537mg [Xenopus laevis]|uniref:Uncharacterized protein n=1 Tax=Xenopus laevis TaxID=8355 RepID=A0A974C0M5_XENLA|nr:hypothetical protein XELAEV_18045537mg [Xenopus laevis]